MSKHEHNVYLDLNSKTLLTVLLITIVGFLLRFYGYSSQGYWMDEDFTFFLTNPGNN